VDDRLGTYAAGRSLDKPRSSVNPLYLTLKDPLMDVYFTLLDISCVAANGKASNDDLVSFSFVPFTTHTDDGNGFPRKGDGKLLSYYKTGVNTAADDTTWTPKGMLGSPEATGRCGGVGRVAETHVEDSRGDDVCTTLVYQGCQT
jgi:hypothetical protein